MKKAYFAFVVLELLFSCSTQEEQAPVIEVQSITIEQNDLTLEEGESMILSAKVLPEDAENKTIKWSSSDESKVMVSSSGKIVAMAIGQSVITAEAGKKSDFITVTVVAKAIPVTGISLTPSSLTIKVSESHTIEAEITPDNATNKNVSWTSSNPEVASVENGIVMGLKPGSVTITAKTDDGGKTAECSVTVKPNLAPSVTVGSSHISAVCAVLSGDANLETTMSADMTMGIMISTNSGVLPSNSTKIVATDISAKQGFDSSYSYSVNATGLEPNSTYYFRSYVTQSGQDTYGETMEFNTKGLASLLATQTSAVTAISSKLQAKADLTDVVLTNCFIGINWGPSQQQLTEKVTGNENEKEIAALVASLQPSTEYYYRGYIVIDNKEYQGDIQSFTTSPLNSLIETLDATDIEPTKASLNARLDLTDIHYNSISYGFYWGTEENGPNTLIETNSLANQAYSAELDNLSHKTQYWYKAYVSLDGRALYGDVLSLTTDVVPVKSVSLNTSDYTFKTIGNTISLKATILPADATDKSITWTSDDETVAKVDANGIVKAISNGKANITVTTNDQAKTASCSITVAQQVTSVSLDQSSITLNEGEEYTLNASVSPENAFNKSLEWTSTDETVAIVDENGKVIAISKGSAGIRATAKDGSGKQSYCSVTVKRLVSTIELNKTSLALHNGESEKIIATVLPETANNRSVEWTSSDPTVASVSSAGEVYGIKRGTTTITVAAKDGSGVTATCEVEVKQYVTSITLDIASISIIEGEKASITVSEVLPDNANDKTYSWKSSDTSIAQVDNGLVTGINKGKTTILAIANDGSGISASCSITVSHACPEGAVDLGFTSADGYKFYWAKCNLGASSPEEYGDFYAWGDVKTQYEEGYNWAHYKWCNGSAESLTKYNNDSDFGVVDNLTTLEMSDDAARTKLGGSWRMPSYAEAYALFYKNCKWESSTLNGIKGVKITSKIEGYTNNWIFLPAAGLWQNTEHIYAGNYIWYWTSSLFIVSYTSAPCYAWYLCDTHSLNSCRRDDGLPIRPVYD